LVNPYIHSTLRTITYNNMNMIGQDKLGIQHYFKKYLAVPI
jgi:hypothetical protein